MSRLGAQVRCPALQFFLGGGSLQGGSVSFTGEIPIRGNEVQKRKGERYWSEEEIKIQQNQGHSRSKDTAVSVATALLSGRLMEAKGQCVRAVKVVPLRRR